MLTLKFNGIPLSALLLTAVLSCFCSASALETSEAESTTSETEEFILGRRQGEKLAKSAEIAPNSDWPKRRGIVVGSQSQRSRDLSEYSNCNGIGRPLRL